MWICSFDSFKTGRPWSKPRESGRPAPPSRCSGAGDAFYHGEEPLGRREELGKRGAHTVCSSITAACPALPTVASLCRPDARASEAASQATPSCVKHTRWPVRRQAGVRPSARTHGIWSAVLLRPRLSQTVAMGPVPPTALRGPGGAAHDVKTWLEHYFRPPPCSLLRQDRASSI